MNSNYFQGKNKALFDAMWQWVLDHSDLTADGVLFLKAHIKDKDSFKKSIIFREKGAYRSFLYDELIEDRRATHLGKDVMRRELAKVEEENNLILASK
jgi:hypothetical protein